MMDSEPECQTEASPLNQGRGPARHHLGSKTVLGDPHTLPFLPLGPCGKGTVGDAPRTDITAAALARATCW